MIVKLYNPSYENHTINLWNYDSVGTAVIMTLHKTAKECDKTSLTSTTCKAGCRFGPISLMQGIESGTSRNFD